MSRRRRIGALAMLGLATTLVVGVLASPASAVVDGPCSGNAIFSNGTTVDAKDPISKVSLIPDEDTVTYNGSITIDPPPDKPVSFTGGVSAAVAGIGTISVVNWGGESEMTSVSNGKYSYEVPSWVPRGTGEITVEANHSQGGVTCAAAVTVALDGSPGAAAAVGAVGTALFFGGTMAAGVKKKGVA